MSLKVIVKGKTSGKLMVSKQPINFLGAVDKKNGIINDNNHKLYKKSIKKSILAFPYGIGSSVGAYTIYSLKSNGTAPAGMICTKADLSVVSGCALANIPLVIISQDEFDSLVDGKKITIDTESGKIL